MGTSAESVKLDEDVHEELRKLAKRSGRPLGALANDALAARGRPKMCSRFSNSSGSHEPADEGRLV